MKLHTKQLRAALGRITPILKSNTANPLSGMIKVVAANDQIELHASGLGVYACAYVNAENTNPTQFCVNGARLAAAVACCDGEAVELRICDNDLIVQHRGTTTLKTIMADDYPSPKMDGLKEIGMETKDLAECLRKVGWISASKDRPLLQNAHVYYADGKLHAEASSGYLYAWTSKTTICGELDALLPLSSLPNLCDELEKDGASFHLSESAVMVKNDFGFTRVQLMDVGKWPEAALAIKESAKASVGSVSAAEFKAETGNAAAMCSDDALENLKLYFTAKALRVSINGKEGQYESFIDGKFAVIDKEFSAKLMAESANRFADEATLEILAADNGLKLSDGVLNVMICDRRKS